MSTLIDVIRRWEMLGEKLTVAEIRGNAVLHGRLEEDFLLTKTTTHWLYTGDNIVHVLAAMHIVHAFPAVSAAIGRFVNACGNRRLATPLHYAADAVVDSEQYVEANQKLTIETLLSLGAHIDCVDKNGKTPLMRAIRCRSWIAVDTLLAHGAACSPGAPLMKLARIATGRGSSGMPLAKYNQTKIIELLQSRI